MIVLACESSTLLGSVAVLKDQAVLGYKESFRQGSHSDVLNVFVESVLNEAGLRLRDVDLFASGIGPGSFTGIRISLNAIKTFAFCYDKPCVGIDSLTNLAHQCTLQAEFENDAERPIVAMINAYKNMVYVATYKKVEGALTVTKGPSVIRVQNLESYLGPASYVVGDGYLTYKNYFDQHLKKTLLRPPRPADEPTANVSAELAFSVSAQNKLNWSQLLPLYLRESEAEENKKGIKYEPLF